MTESRSYQSPLREQQREQTRRRIIDAAIELLADEGELNIPHVAERAGVATRTVYFHFESKAGLTEALSNVLDEEVGIAAFPDSAAELIDYSAEWWSGFPENEQLWRALTSSGAGGDVRTRGRQRRFSSFKNAVDSHVGDLDPDEQVLAAALIYMQFSLMTRFALIDNFGLSAEQVGRGTRWAIRTLLEELERNPGGPIE